jgi:hypothetical protein
MKRGVPMTCGLSLETVTYHLKKRSEQANVVRQYNVNILK